MKQQLVYVALSYGIGLICFSGLILWVRRHRLRSFQFLKQSFVLQNHESNSKE